MMFLPEGWRTRPLLSAGVSCGHNCRTTVVLHVSGTLKLDKCEHETLLVCSHSEGTTGAYDTHNIPSDLFSRN